MAVVGGALHTREVGDEVEGAAATSGTGSMVTEGSREAPPSLAPSAHMKSFMQKPALNTCPHFIAHPHNGTSITCPWQGFVQNSNGLHTSSDLRGPQRLHHIWRSSQPQICRTLCSKSAGLLLLPEPLTVLRGTQPPLAIRPPAVEPAPCPGTGG